MAPRGACGRYARARRRVAPDREHRLWILAFDTATAFGAVCAVTPDRRARAARAGDLLVAVDGLVDDPAAIEGIVVGRGPGSFTSIRIGLATARTLALALDVPVAGASTLEAFAAGTPVLDARRGEVFTTGPRVCKPQELDVAGLSLVGDGAIRYRALFEERGATISSDADDAHVPDPLLLVERAGAFGAGRARRAALRPRSRCEAAAMTTVALEIRPLDLADLTAIESIEQRAYPTPWSRSMFASELAKPTSICLGAFEGERPRRLRDQLALRRRVARDERRGRSGAPAPRCRDGASGAVVRVDARR